MPTPSPAFTFSGGVNKYQATAAGSVVATLSSLDGVSSVTWSVVGTDESSTAPAITTSGTLGSVATLTAGAAGTAGILKCTVNGGINRQTGEPDASLSTTRKWWVPATGTGLEVGCIGEEYESDSTYGWVGVVNPAIRNVAAGGVTSVSGSAPIVSSGGVTPTISISAATTLAAGSMSAADKTKLDWLPSSLTADRVLLTNGSGAIATTRTPSATQLDSVGVDSYVQIGASAAATGGAIRMQHEGQIAARNSTDAGNAVVATFGGGTGPDELDLGDASYPTHVHGSACTVYAGATAALACSSTRIDVGVPDVRFGETIASPVITQTQRTTDAAPQSLTIKSQEPWASATGANRTPGDIVLQVPSPAAGGSAGEVSINISGAERARLTRYEGVFNLGGSAVRVGSYYSSPGTPNGSYAAIYFGTNALDANASSTNYGFLGDNADVYLNAASGLIYLLGGGSPSITITPASNLFTFSNTTSGPVFSQTSKSGNGNDWLMSAQSSSASNGNGGWFGVRGGARNGSGLKGGVFLSLNADSSDRMLELVEVAASRRVLALCQSAALTTTEMPANSGDRVVYLANAATACTAAPTGGVVISAESGLLRARVPNNVVTDIAPAGVSGGLSTKRWIHQHGRVQTTDATPTTVITVAIPASSVAVLEGFLIAKRTDVEGNVVGVKTGCVVKRTGSAAPTIPASWDDGSYEDDAACAWRWVVVGNDVTLEFTGVLGHTYEPDAHVIGNIGAI